MPKINQKGGGSWGTFDDENDSVHDHWIDIENEAIPKCLKDIKKHVEPVMDEYYSVIRSYIRNNPKETYSVLLKKIKEINKYKVNDDRDNDIKNRMISGLVLYATKFMQNIYPSYVFTDNTIPKDFPKGFPDNLRRMALKATKEQIKNVDLNLGGWFNLNKRKKSLQAQLFFFSKGKEGVQGKHPKIKNIAKKEPKKKSSRKGSKKKSSRKGSKKKTSRKGSKKKTSRKGSKKKSSRKGTKKKTSRKESRKGSTNKERKGPSVSATKFVSGTVMTGNDGNQWVIKEYKTKNGFVKRWIKM